VDHIVQPNQEGNQRGGIFKNLLDNVWMSQLSQGGDLSQSGAWNALIFILEFHFFHSNNQIRLSISCFVNHAIGPFTTVTILF
jgi:hypothetical protein